MAWNSSACAVVNESGIGIAWAAGLLLGPRVRPEYVHPRNPPPDRQGTGIAVDHFANLPNSPDALQPRSVGQRDVGDAIVTHGSIRSTTIRLSSRGTGSGTSCSIGPNARSSSTRGTGGERKGASLKVPSFRGDDDSRLRPHLPMVFPVNFWEDFECGL